MIFLKSGWEMRGHCLQGGVSFVFVGKTEGESQIRFRCSETFTPPTPRRAAAPVANGGNSSEDTILPTQ
jgi:hypothetical protein